MKISDFTYLLVSSILLLSFWNITPIVSIFNRDTIFLLSMVWLIIGLYLPQKKSKLPTKFFKKYNWIWICIFLGIFISMCNAYLFWGQNILTTFIAQRFTYTFILIPTLIKIQPSSSCIIRVLKVLSYITLTTWIISIINPNLIATISEDTINRKESTENTDIGYYVTGINIVVFYTYFLIQEYIKKFNYKKFFIAIFWITFIILYQNRSMLLGVIIIFLYSLTKLKSRYKPIIIISICLFICIFLNYTWNIWLSLIEESQNQLADDDYNRWKALDYYLNYYSPNLWCYLLGNGMPSGGNSILGNLYWQNMSKGIFISDIGMVGMWVNYGIISIFSIYYIIIKILTLKKFPLWIKFMSFHILIVPTIFTFGNGNGILLFSLLIYSYIYYSKLPYIQQKHKLYEQYACSYYNKLQERTTNN